MFQFFCAVPVIKNVWSALLIFCQCKAIQDLPMTGQIDPARQSSDKIKANSGTIQNCREIGKSYLNIFSLSVNFYFGSD